jgi:transcription initiation factor IIE alpha subunit
MSKVELCRKKIDAIIDELERFKEYEVNAHFYECEQSFPVKMFRDALIAIREILDGGKGE